ncbi:MAG: DUF4136 domain-containing protein [Alcanivoracaceae bacterium]
MRPIILFVTVWLAGCASTVAIDHQRDAAFADFRTYAFVRPASEERIRSLDDERIEQAVNRELAQRQFSEATPDQADLLVRYRVEDTLQLESSGFSYGFGFGRDSLGIGLSTAPDRRAVKEGKLVIELVQRDNLQVVWRGTGQRNLTEQMKPDQRTALIERLVRDMFGKYPP